MVLKSDQEPSIRALCTQVQKSSAAEVVLDAAPIEGHEKSNGEAEATVEVAELLRTLRKRVQFYAGVEIPAKHPIMARIVEQAGTMLNLFSTARDGLTVQPLERDTAAYCVGTVWRTRGVHQVYETQARSTLGTQGCSWE